MGSPDLVTVAPPRRRILSGAAEVATPPSGSRAFRPFAREPTKGQVRLQIHTRSLRPSKPAGVVGTSLTPCNADSAIAKSSSPARGPVWDTNLATIRSTGRNRIIYWV